MISHDYLSVIFKREMGQSLHSYIVDEKLKAVKAMLQNGMKVSYVSYTLAFSSESHFVSLFKQKYGITPGKYKQKEQH